MSDPFAPLEVSVSLPLRPDFLWGTATAAAQIEGAAHRDGKTDSIWDAFARVPGAVAGGDTPEVACDHYNRMPEDVALLQSLGVDSYRFSVSWARVRPDGGPVNPAGLDFYSRLVDVLLEAGILPWLTLYHWDLPQKLEELGGWPARDTAARFVDYALDVHNRLGDRVTHWTTFNEPFCSSLLGYAAGVHAPGRREPSAALAAVHHQHLAHGLAVAALRDVGVEQIGITLNLSTGLPLDPHDAVDATAAQHFELLQNDIFLDPILRGSYSELAWSVLGPLGLSDVVQDTDLATISAPLDFVGVNYYHDDCVSGHVQPGSSDPHGGAGGASASPWIGIDTLTFPTRHLPRTAMDWEVNPDGLRHLLVRLTESFPNLPPLYVTENGAAYDDVVGADGVVHDHARARYVMDHLDALESAVRDGVDVRGYFLWSLLDNFEWSYGYSKRFGIVRVDYATQERTLKFSAHAYKDRIRMARGL